MVAARKRENQNRINFKIYLFFSGKEILHWWQAWDNRMGLILSLSGCKIRTLTRSSKRSWCLK